jgi:hypothetical protein
LQELDVTRIDGREVYMSTGWILESFASNQNFLIVTCPHRIDSNQFDVLHGI